MRRQLDPLAADMVTASFAQEFDSLKAGFLGRCTIRLEPRGTKSTALVAEGK